MTGMPRNFRPIIGRDYAGPNLDRPALRRMPAHWVLEESRRAPAWWRFWTPVDRLIGRLCAVILLFALFSAIGQVRAGEKNMRATGKAFAGTANEIQPKTQRPGWERQHCAGRSFIAIQSDARPWKVRCTGRLVRS